MIRCVRVLDLMLCYYSMASSPPQSDTPFAVSPGHAISSSTVWHLLSIQRTLSLCCAAPLQHGIFYRLVSMIECVRVLGLILLFSLLIHNPAHPRLMLCRYGMAFPPQSDETDRRDIMSGTDPVWTA